MDVKASWTTKDVALSVHRGFRYEIIPTIDIIKNEQVIKTNKMSSDAFS